MIRKSDAVAAGFLAGVPLLFVLLPSLAQCYADLNASHAYLMSFAKFALLATFGECFALRIVSGRYWKPDFGVLPKAVVWGVLGVIIKAAFVVFASGVPNLLAGFGLPADALRSEGLSAARVGSAFAVSVFMNCIFAPVFMTLHKLTDAHIHNHNGKLCALWQPADVGALLRGVNWDVMWGFVFRKTIPLFWIPAHTITFLLPPAMQTLFAAILGIVLGVLLAVAALSGKK
ncbi:hypothetical protein [Oleidesulfovibrio sp.]|uniref:hypothetical protein n=1 Tax=Oleidesulfovibrio sp. TaxID=2909707 RepID=UPI003A8BA607